MIQTKPLPASLGALGAELLGTDALCGLLVIGVAYVAGFAAPAFMSVAAAILCALAIGRYRVSFAVTPREEWYSAGAVAILGGIAGLLVSIALGFAWPACVVAIAIWYVVASLCGAFLHRQQREDGYTTSLHHVREATLNSHWHAEQHVVRLLDFIFTVVALLVLWPVFLIVALVVLIDDGTPVLFGQTRVAQDDREFTMWKFRTMRRDADSRWAAPGDDRITKVGKRLRSSSLDELPQLVNVLAGEMSLVGPRPEMREYADEFAQTFTHYSQRHIVRPGLTGWAQVRLRRNFQPSEVLPVLEHDLFYVQHASVQLYMFCLIKTAAEIFHHEAV